MGVSDHSGMNSSSDRIFDVLTWNLERTRSWVVYVERGSKFLESALLRAASIDNNVFFIRYSSCQLLAEFLRCSKDISVDNFTVAVVWSVTMMWRWRRFYTFAFRPLFVQSVGLPGRWPLMKLVSLVCSATTRIEPTEHTANVKCATAVIQYVRSCSRYVTEGYTLKNLKCFKFRSAYSPFCTATESQKCVDLCVG